MENAAVAKVISHDENLGIRTYSRMHWVALIVIALVIVGIVMCVAIPREPASMAEIDAPPTTAPVTSPVERPVSPPTSSPTRKPLTPSPTVSPVSFPALGPSAVDQVSSEITVLLGGTFMSPLFMVLDRTDLISFTITSVPGNDEYELCIMTSDSEKNS